FCFLKFLAGIFCGSFRLAPKIFSRAFRFAVDRPIRLIDTSRHGQAARYKNGSWDDWGGNFLSSRNDERRRAQAPADSRFWGLLDRAEPVDSGEHGEIS